MGTDITELTPNLAGLEECILLQRLALELLPPSHPHRPIILDILAGILIYQSYLNSWDKRDEDLVRLSGKLDEAISLRRQALEPTPSNLNAVQQGILLSLADSLNFRFHWSFQLWDLNEAIFLHRHFLGRLPSSHPCQPTILKCLAMELLDRYREEKQSGDLDEAIILFKQYLHLPPPFRPDRPDILLTLSDALFDLPNTPRGDIDEDLLLELAKTSGEGRWYYKSSTKDSLQRSS